MKPEEKEALALIKKFDFIFTNDEAEHFCIASTIKDRKQCALIAIEYALQFVGGDIEEEFDKTLYLVTLKNIINDKF